MARDPERIERVSRALRASGLTAVTCSFPTNVLMLSGYWPVVGTSVAVVSAEGELGLAVPEDEKTLAERANADQLVTFQPVSLDALRSPSQAVREPLYELTRKLGVKKGQVGYEAGWLSQPSSYAAMTLYGAEMGEVLAHALPERAVLEPADSMLGILRSTKTAVELEHIRAACRRAGEGFVAGASTLRPGIKESESVAPFRSTIRERSIGDGAIARADAFVYCMSGKNSAQAYGAYARTRARQIEPGDLVLAHCNSYADGYWTDITRTYCLGRANDRQSKIYDAIFTARRAVLDAIRPGVPAAQVDAAARGVLAKRGFEKEFRHATGHGVGFGAIDPNALPRLHPKSPDLLEVGMVFNVEPAVYVEGFGGIRHCDMVAVTDSGAEVLTPFQSEIESLVLRNDHSARPAA